MLAPQPLSSEHAIAIKTSVLILEAFEQCAFFAAFIRGERSTQLRQRPAFSGA